MMQMNNKLKNTQHQKTRKISNSKKRTFSFHHSFTIFGIVTIHLSSPKKRSPSLFLGLPFIDISKKEKDKKKNPLSSLLIYFHYTSTHGTTPLACTKSTHRDAICLYTWWGRNLSFIIVVHPVYE